MRFDPSLFVQLAPPRVRVKRLAIVLAIAVGPTAVALILRWVLR